MRKNYTSALNVPVIRKEILEGMLSPSKSTVDKIIAFSAAYWTAPVLRGMRVERILN